MVSIITVDFEGKILNDRERRSEIFGLDDLVKSEYKSILSYLHILIFTMFISM